MDAGAELVSTAGQNLLWHLSSCLCCQNGFLPLCCWVMLLYLVSTGVRTQFAFILHVEMHKLTASGWLVTTVMNAL